MHIALPKSRSGQGLPPSEWRLGFLAAGLNPSIGYLGGYLLTTARGRPLEFHYTSPVKPSATHRILYGAELEPYLYGELVAAALLEQSSIEPAFVITDQPLILAYRTRSSYPLLCVTGRQAPDECATVATKPVHESAAATIADELQTHPDFPSDRDTLNQLLREANPGLDPREPFSRIWEALRELHGGDTRRQAA
jgi:hypothetical protein